ncbi:MAG: hypothetical protein PUP92_26665, partial [Rhizonema sp. PD38]|nr:hypothetical protein [Rhizonema sp. PD38]
CTINITAAVISPALNEQYSIWVRMGGIFVGWLYMRSASGIFKPIKQLNNQRIDLKKKPESLNLRLNS